MKQFVLVMGLILESDPLSNQFTTLIRDVDNIVESDDVYELETMGGEYLANGGHAYKILDNTHEHEGVVWSNKAVNQVRVLRSNGRHLTNINWN